MRTTSSTQSNVASGEEPQQVFFDPYMRDSKQRIVETPVFAEGTHIADTHAHLDMLHHPHLALARAAVHNVDFIVSIIDPTEDPSFTLDNLDDWLNQAQELLDAWHKEESFSVAPLTTPLTRLAMGCHPHNAAQFTNEVEKTLVDAISTDSRVLAVGEIGLDYHYDNSPRPVQKEVFKRQIELAHTHDLPIILHLREAHEEGLALLKEAGLPQRGALLHCFNLDLATLEPFVELGCMVAYGGPLTFKKSDEVRYAAEHTPLERIVTETDCPFMAPVPVRGTVCEPASVMFTAQLLSQLIPEKTTLETLYQNAQRFFLPQ